MTKAKYNFIEQIYMAITRPTKYFRLTKVGGGRITAFVFLFVLITSLFTIIPLVFTLAGPNGITSYLDDLPDFQFSNGEFHMAQRFEENDGINYVLIDSSVDKFTTDDINEVYTQVILVSKTNMIVYQYGRTQEYNFADLGNMAFDNSILNKFLPIIYIILAWIVVFIYLYLVAVYFLTALLFSLVGLIVALAMNIQIKYAAIFKTAIYGKVTAALLSVLLTVLQYFTPLNIPGAISIGIMILITCAYVVYGTISHNSEEAIEEASNSLPPVSPM